MELLTIVQPLKPCLMDNFCLFWLFLSESSSSLIFFLLNHFVSTCFPELCSLLSLLSLEFLNKFGLLGQSFLLNFYLSRFFLLNSQLLDFFLFASLVILALLFNFFGILFLFFFHIHFFLFSEFRNFFFIVFFLVDFVADPLKILNFGFEHRSLLNEIVER